MKALVLNAEGRTARVQDQSPASPASNEVLIKVHAIALNPVDVLYVHSPLGLTGRVVGSDFAGTVCSSGEAALANGRIRVGDRVAGFLQGACSINDRPGAFAEYLVCPWDLVWRITERLSFEEAASVSLCGLTAAQALFYRLGLASPFTWAGQSDSKLIDEEGAVCFFIYGASTSVGLYAAQLVRRSAEAHDTTIKLFGAASPSNFDMLKAPPYEYDHLVDYHDAKWPEQVLRYTDGAGVHFAYDCISEGTSVSQVCHSLRSGGKMAVVRSRAGGAWMADDLATEPIYGAVWEGLGVEVQYQGMTVPESLEARDFAVSFYMWLSNGAALQPNPIRLMPGGLESVVADGFALLGPGLMKDRAQGRTEAWLKPVSAEKLVYKI